MNGAQQALDILARLLLELGDKVLVETPGFADAMSLFQLHGAQLMAVPVDDAGILVNQIPPHSQVKLVFVTPSNQFPQGGTLPLPRRLALLEWTRRQQAFIIEDDYDGELRYDARPLAALQGLAPERDYLFGYVFKGIVSGTAPVLRGTTSGIGTAVCAGKAAN